MVQPAGDARLLDVDLNITARCNLRCSFCSVSIQPVAQKCDELSLDEIERLLVDLDKMGVQVVRLVGGEPFVRRDIEDILRLLGSFCFFSSVLTNATVMKQRHVKLIKESGIDVVAFSVDGHTAALHDASRGKPRSFERLIEMVKCCNEAEVRHRMMTAVTVDTLPHLEELVRFAGHHGFEALNFIVLGLGGAATSAPHRFPTYAAWSRAIVDLTNFLASQRSDVLVSLLFPHEDPVPVELYEPLSAAGMLPLLQSVWHMAPPAAPQWGASICNAGHSSISIMPNGDVYGCDLMRELPHLRAGNVRETPVAAIFEGSSLFRRWRESPSVKACAAPGPESRDFSCGQCRAGIAHLGQAAVAPVVFADRPRSVSSPGSAHRTSARLL